MIPNRIVTGLFFLLFTYALKAQLHDGRTWFCDECTPKVVGKLGQIPRDGTTWKTKANWQMKEFNISLKFIDSISFEYTFSDGVGRTKHYYKGKVNDQDTLVFHGFACIVTMEGDTITRRYFKNNYRDSSYWAYDMADSTERSTYFEDGLCQGFYTIMKGQDKVLEGQFKDGTRAGIWKYYAKGNLICRGKYSGELYDGWITFPDGLFGDGAEVSARIPVRSGKWYFYNPDSKVLRIEYYSKSGYLKRSIYRSKFRRSPEIENITSREVNL